MLEQNQIISRSPASAVQTLPAIGLVFKPVARRFCLERVTGGRESRLTLRIYALAGS